MELPGSISQGEALNELMKNMKDAISLILESIKEEASIGNKEIQKQENIFDQLGSNIRY